MVRLQGWRDLLWLVIQLEAVQDSLLLELNLPGSATDRVAGGHGRDNQLCVLDLESFVLVEGNELDLRESAFHILQRVGVEVVQLFLLDQELIHGLGAELCDWRCRKDALDVVEVTCLVEKGQCADLLDCGVGDENEMALLRHGLNSPDRRCHVRHLLVVNALVTTAVKQNFDVANAEQTARGIVLLLVKNVGELYIRWHIL